MKMITETVIQHIMLQNKATQISYSINRQWITTMNVGDFFLTALKKVKHSKLYATRQEK
jgi:hypothetical protein